MHIEHATPQAGPDSEYLWLREGSLPHTREDRLAEALALFALLFSLGIGFVIAVLPVSASADASIERTGAHIVAARDAG